MRGYGHGSKYILGYSTTLYSTPTKLDGGRGYSGGLICVTSISGYVGLFSQASCMHADAAGFFADLTRLIDAGVGNDL